MRSYPGSKPAGTRKQNTGSYLSRYQIDKILLFLRNNSLTPVTLLKYGPSSDILFSAYVFCLRRFSRTLIQVYVNYCRGEWYFTVNPPDKKRRREYNYIKLNYLPIAEEVMVDVIKHARDPHIAPGAFTKPLCEITHTILNTKTPDQIET